jgi:hypothetical protein
LSPCIQTHSFIIKENILGGKLVEVEENISTKEGKFIGENKEKGKEILFGINLWNLIRIENDEKWLGGTLEC